MDNKMLIINNKGEFLDVNVVMCFKIEKLGKEYIVYTFSDEDQGDLVTIHTSSLIKDVDGSYKIEDIEDNHEWKLIKNVMKKIVEQAEEV